MVLAEHIRVGGVLDLDGIADRLRAYSPRTDLGRIIRTAFGYLPADLAGELLDTISRIVVIESSLSAVLVRASGRREPLGVVSRRVITDAGVAYLVDAWQNTVELETMKYHGVGTGGTAESAAQTALVTESTTALNPDSTRATGSLAEASAAVFRTVGTPVFDASAAITEHGIFSQAATGGGTMWDRSLFSAINVVATDSIQFTYDMTATAGG